MASTSDIRNGLCIKYNNDIYKIIELQNADYIEIMWHTASTSAYISYTGPAVTPTRPATPSVIAELNFVSSIPA